MATQEYGLCSVEDSNKKGDACLAIAFVKKDGNVEFFPDFTEADKDMSSEDVKYFALLHLYEDGDIRIMKTWGPNGLTIEIIFNESRALSVSFPTDA